MVELLEYAHALWSRPTPKGDTFKTLARAWYDALGDLNVEDVRDALLYLSAEREFLARPAQVRRLVIDTTFPDQVPPSGDEAWELWLELAAGVNHGTAQPTELHPVVAATIRKIRSGDTRDRQHFLGLYTAERDRFDQDRYAR